MHVIDLIELIVYYSYHLTMLEASLFIMLNFRSIFEVGYVGNRIRSVNLRLINEVNCFMSRFDVFNDRISLITSFFKLKDQCVLFIIIVKVILFSFFNHRFLDQIC